jgi:branched-chain amino acid transport system ATP-binding protein
MLELKGLSKHFGGVRAVDGLDFAVREGEIVGLIGPNGSGKSTAINLVCGVFPVTQGRITFDGWDITAAKPHVCLALGIARTFQNIRLFNQLTVWQNLWVAQNSAGHALMHGLIRRWVWGRGRAKQEVEEYLEFSGLAHRRDELAGNLSFGEQRRLELARALAAKPRLLLLDEPAAGMNAEEVGQLADRIRALQAAGKTVVLVEHVMELVMGVTERIAVLNFGRKIAEGTPAEVQANHAVREAYLGTGAKS